MSESARAALVHAHRHMTPSEIAEHALLLAERLEIERRFVVELVEIACSSTVVANRQIALARGAVAMFKAHKKLDARRTIEEAAAVPLVVLPDLSAFISPLPAALLSGEN